MGHLWTGAVSVTPQWGYLLGKRPWLVGCQGHFSCCGEGRILNARFDILTSVLLQIAVLWNVMLCCWVSSSWHWQGSVVASSSGSKQYKTSALKLKLFGPLIHQGLLAEHSITSQKTEILKCFKFCSILLECKCWVSWEVHVNIEMGLLCR